jgi:hypothetical protein
LALHLLELGAYFSRSVRHVEVKNVDRLEAGAAPAMNSLELSAKMPRETIFGVLPVNPRTDVGLLAAGLGELCNVKATGCV